jgi:HSP20 family protein
MANIVRFDPLSELQALQKQFLGDDWFSTILPNNIVQPTTDVYMDGAKQMIVEAHLPNFDQNDVNINIDDDMLEIQAAKHETDQDKDKKYVIRESSNSFYRRVRLPAQANASKVKAEMEDGVLRIQVPLKPLPAPKKIAIVDTKGSAKYEH